MKLTFCKKIPDDSGKVKYACFWCQMKAKCLSFRNNIGLICLSSTLMSEKCTKRQKNGQKGCF